MIKPAVSALLAATFLTCVITPHESAMAQDEKRPLKGKGGELQLSTP